MVFGHPLVRVYKQKNAYSEQKKTPPHISFQRFNTRTFQIKCFYLNTVIQRSDIVLKSGINSFFNTA